MSLYPCLANPNLALALLLAGIFLIYAECNRPGNVLLGSCGTFAGMLGIYGLSLHRVSAAGLLCLLAALVLLLLQLRFNTRYLLPSLSVGFLTVGIAALVPGPSRINPLVASVVASLFTLVTLPLARIALRARRNKRIHFDPRTTSATLPRPAAGVD